MPLKLPLNERSKRRFTVDGDDRYAGAPPEVRNATVAAHEFLYRHVLRWFDLPVTNWLVWRDPTGHHWLLWEWFEGEPPPPGQRIRGFGAALTMRLVLDAWFGARDLNWEHVLVPDAAADEAERFVFIDFERLEPFFRADLPGFFGDTPWNTEFVDLADRPTMAACLDRAWALPQDALVTLLDTTGSLWPGFEEVRPQWTAVLAERRNRLGHILLTYLGNLGLTVPLAVTPPSPWYVQDP